MLKRKADISFNVLGEEGVRRIHNDALIILEKNGIRVDDSELRKILIKNVAKGDSRNCFRFSREMVQDALSQVNRKPVIKCINGK